MVDPLGAFSFPVPRRKDFFNGPRVWAISAAAAALILVFGIYAQSLERTEFFQSEMGYFLDVLHEPAWNPDTLLIDMDSTREAPGAGLLDWLDS